LKTILENQLNFRDLGGIITVDGHRVKPGLLFRSGELYTVSDADMLRLEQMNLAMNIDLRAQREITKRPDKKSEP